MDLHNVYISFSVCFEDHFCTEDNLRQAKHVVLYNKHNSVVSEQLLLEFLYCDFFMSNKSIHFLYLFFKLPPRNLIKFTSKHKLLTITDFSQILILVHRFLNQIQLTSVPGGAQCPKNTNINMNCPENNTTQCNSICPNYQQHL